MSDIAIRVEGLSKRYFISGKPERYKALRDVLTETIVSPFRRAGKLLRGQATGAADLYKEFWALKDVSFQVAPGEVVGLIGPNGAGKSTLLKILTRITEPTKGYAEIYGRVGSLLEVGTGFHPELTGRENVYLNGGILGMKKAEIDRKFDEIVDFAEVEEFIDTPVKHYSSGMSVRLAFAVAAHLETEILLVDEVLAVGDARFQRKCLNKMEDVGRGGRTVIFVSHNMQAVTRLCQRVILLDSGRVENDGPSQKIVGHYLNSGIGRTAVREWTDPKAAPGGEVARLRRVQVRIDEGYFTEILDIRKQVYVEMEYEVLKHGFILAPNFSFWNEEGVCAFASQDLDPIWRRRPRPKGRYVSTAKVPGNFFSEGTVFVRADLTTLEPLIVQFIESHVVAFHVVDPLVGDSVRGDYTGRMLGVVRPMLEWTTQHHLNGRDVTDIEYPHTSHMTNDVLENSDFL